MRNNYIFHKEGMMLKINKTLPKNKARESRYRCMQCIALVALICGIMPGLMGLGFYGDDSSNKVYAAKLSIDNISTMQEMRPGICHNMNIGDTTTLTDTRDESTYTIAKLSDGKCWMTENLRLTGGTVLNRTDTDLDPNIYTSNEQTYTLPETTEGGFSNAKFADSTGTETYMNHQMRNSTDNDYGAYYSWCAATAGTCQVGSYIDIQPKLSTTNNVYYTANPTNTTSVIASANATSSICPRGWKLPTGGNNGDFKALFNVYPKGAASNNSIGWLDANGEGNIIGKAGRWIGGKNIDAGGTFFLAAGYNAGNAGTLGHYWSSTASAADDVLNARLLYFSNNSIGPTHFDDRYFGFSVRCLSDSYAEEDVNVVAVKVAPTISIDASTGANVEVDPNVVSTDGTITATISANTTYDVLLSADEPNLVSTTDTTKYIPASSNIAIRTNGWGIKNNDNTYSAITTSPTTYYNTSSYDETKQQTLHTFSLGISITPSLPSGTYSTTVTVTAVNN